MSSEYGKEIQEDLKLLIRHLFKGSPFEENNPAFKKVLKHWTTTIKKSDTMYYPNKTDIDHNIQSMMEKFTFHGCLREAEILGKIYKNYTVTEDLPSNICMNRLKIVKFLLCSSETPVKKLLETPYEFKLDEEEELKREEELDIDWGEYLKEGFEKWQPNSAASEDIDSDSSAYDSDHTELQETCSKNTLLPVVIKSSEKLCTMDLQTSRNELKAVVQHSWYHSDHFQMVPESELRQANIGILWEEHLRDQVKSLILLENPSIISEYNVIREILWQLRCPHTSTVFEIRGNILKPKKNITLASVRQNSFYNFMETFIPYIELLNYFREFQMSLGSNLDENIPVTYICYYNSLNSILRPIYKKLCDIENTVAKQDKIYTLQNLSQELSNILQPVKILKEIHESVILDPTVENPMKSATNLLAKLHASLHQCVDKLEQDLKVSLFLESSYYYFSIVQFWLMADNLTDHTGEFVIEEIFDEENNSTFNVKRDIDEFCKNNSFLKLFCDRILQIGTNIHFYRVLGKYDKIGDFSGTIYKEFIEKVISKLQGFYHNEKVQKSENSSSSDLIEENFKNNLNNPYLNNMENSVDLSDGFLMCAFSDFFGKEKDKANRIKNGSLYEKLSNTTKSLFPKTNFFENIVLHILNERFTISGLMVKKLLIDEHLLEKQFIFLRHLYLFWDDLNFPFYRRLFSDAESSRTNKTWAYEIWLTSYLQDIFMDLYPEFYEKCSVSLKEQFTLCDDPLKASNFLRINFEVGPPLNLIIQRDHIEKYQEIFQFILTLKWAIHTVNYLVFTDLEPKTLPFRASKTQKLNRKLKQIKFSLINMLHSLQHFIFGSIFSKNLGKFELDFEKAKDLSDIIESHTDFISSLHSSIIDIKKSVMGADSGNNVLTCIKLLKRMWNDENAVTLDALKQCQKLYEEFSKKVCPIVFPKYIYDT